MKNSLLLSIGIPLLVVAIVAAAIIGYGELLLAFHGTPAIIIAVATMIVIAAVAAAFTMGSMRIPAGEAGEAGEAEVEVMIDDGEPFKRGFGQGALAFFLLGMLLIAANFLLMALGVYLVDLKPF